jgi:HD-like signal output (HDOD) protein/CheY-like chemotaxis protein
MGASKHRRLVPHSRNATIRKVHGVIEPTDFTERAAGKLPSSKSAAFMVMRLCQDEKVSLMELARAIQHDPALSGRIIKIANGANPSKSRPIASVTTDTLALIGIHATRQALLGMSVISDCKNGPCKSFDYEYFWSRAVATACAAHAINAASRVAPSPEIFNCGLMSGIGQLALATAYPEIYGEILSQFSNAFPEALMQAERERLGIDQRAAMTLVLQDLGMPKLFMDALYYHEDPASSGFPENSRLLRLTLTLKMASLLADSRMQEEVNADLAAQIASCGVALGLDQEQLDDVARQTTTGLRNWARLMNIQLQHYPPRKLPKPEIPVTLKKEPSPEAIPQAAAPLRITIVSADKKQRAQLEKFLISAGHSVSIADNGPAILKMTEQKHTEVIIADWLLPGMDGIRLCSDVRALSGNKPLYFILLSHSKDERRMMDAYEAGVDEVMRSPVNMRLLAARLLAAQRISGAGP